MIFNQLNTMFDPTSAITSAHNLTVALSNFKQPVSTREIAEFLAKELPQLFERHMVRHKDKNKAINCLSGEVSASIVTCLMGKHARYSDPTCSMHYNPNVVREKIGNIWHYSIKPTAQIISIMKEVCENPPSFDRLEIEKTGIEQLSEQDKARYLTFWQFAKKLNEQTSSLFDVDHANSIAEYKIKAIHPDNLQILHRSTNRKKGDTSTRRLSFTEQKNHILRSVEVAFPFNHLDLHVNFEDLKLVYS